MRPFGIFVALIWLLAAPSSYAWNDELAAEFAESDQRQPHVVLVSMDSLRWDFPDLFPAPNIQRMMKEGARAERLLPVFPTLTFPNHYSIVTGLKPAQHGLVANDFFDRVNMRWYFYKNKALAGDGSFYGGTPIWSLAQQQGMLSASYFWVGSEAEIEGQRPAYWKPYDYRVPGEERVQQVLDWLQLPTERRPQLITLYFGAVDHFTHEQGVGSRASIDAIAQVDAYLGLLLDGISDLPHADEVTVILVSDHGQKDFLNKQPFFLDRHMNLDGWMVVEGGAYLFAWQKVPDEKAADEAADLVNENWRYGTAYTPRSAPAEWGLQESDRVPDLLLIGDPGHSLMAKWTREIPPGKGDHGWEPDVSEMHGFFAAWGNRVKPGVEVGPVKATDVYALMVELLELTPPPKMESDRSFSEPFLEDRPEVP